MTLKTGVEATLGLRQEVGAGCGLVLPSTNAGGKKSQPWTYVIKLQSKRRNYSMKLAMSI